MVSNDITTAATRSTKASKALDTMRARITKADEARTEAAHQTLSRPGRPGRDRGRDRQPRRGRGVGCAGDPCRHTRGRVSPRRRAGRPHPPPVGALSAPRSHARAAMSPRRAGRRLHHRPTHGRDLDRERRHAVRPHGCVAADDPGH